MLVLRRAGVAQADVARLMGVSPSYVCDSLRLALRSVAAEDSREVLELEKQRLDELQNAFYDRALSGEIEALWAVLAIMKSRSKLYGLELIPPHAPEPAPDALATTDPMAAQRLAEKLLLAYPEVLRRLGGYGAKIPDYTPTESAVAREVIECAQDGEVTSIVDRVFGGSK
jgi:hypothetical protein